MFQGIEVGCMPIHKGLPESRILGTICSAETQSPRFLGRKEERFVKRNRNHYFFTMKKHNSDDFLRQIAGRTVNGNTFGSFFLLNYRWVVLTAVFIKQG